MRKPGTVRKVKKEYERRRDKRWEKWMDRDSKRKKVIRNMK
jgi:hypothetical protein